MLAGSVLTLFSGCGFHLKGAHQAGSASIYPVYENISPPFKREFHQLLVENGQLAINSESADINLRFLKESWQKQSLSVADNGIPAEYRLRYTISYRYKKRSAGDVDNVEQHQEITESRDFTSNNSQLLAIESEQAILKQQIQQRVGLQIIRQLNQIKLIK